MQYIKFHSLKAIQRGMLTGKAPRPTYVLAPAPTKVEVKDPPRVTKPTPQ